MPAEKSTALKAHSIGFRDNRLKVSAEKSTAYKTLPHAAAAAAAAATADDAADDEVDDEYDVTVGPGGLC